MRADAPYILSSFCVIRTIGLIHLLVCNLSAKIAVCKLLLTLHFCINRFFVPRFIFGTLSAQMCTYLIPRAIYSLSLQTKRLILAVSGNWIDFALLRLVYNLSACMHCLGNSYWRGHICKQWRVQLARS